MKFQFMVSADVERESGKVATREEIAGQLQDAIQDADPCIIEKIGPDRKSVYTCEFTIVDEKPEGTEAALRALVIGLAKLEEQHMSADTASAEKLDAEIKGVHSVIEWLERLS